MGTLIVRNVDDDLIDRLKDRAVRHGRSMEAEHRELLLTLLRAEHGADVRRRLSALREATSGRRHTPAERLQQETREEKWG